MDAPDIGKLFEAFPPAKDEIVTELLRRPGVKIERIVSTGQVSPPGFWYDQPDDEWVVLLSGGARIAFDFDDGGEHTLVPGDHLLIPAHRRHRVTWTDPEAATVWLAVHVAAATVG